MHKKDPEPQTRISGSFKYLFIFSFNYFFALFPPFTLEVQYLLYELFRHSVISLSDMILLPKF
jgi:hypothetical protein